MNEEKKQRKSMELRESVAKVRDSGKGSYNVTEQQMKTEKGDMRLHFEVAKLAEDKEWNKIR